MIVINLEDFLGVNQPDPKDLLKSLIKNVEAHKEIRTQAEKIQERHDYLENVKDKYGIIELGHEAMNLQAKARKVAFQESMLINRIVMNSESNFRYN